MAKTKRTVLRRSTDEGPERFSMKSAGKNFFRQDNLDWAYNYVKTLKEEKNMTYNEIAQHLTAEGWTGAKGAPLSQPVITRFMTRRGYRIHGPRREQTHELGGGPTQTPIEYQISALLKTLDETTKLRIMRDLADRQLREINRKLKKQKK